MTEQHTPRRFQVDTAVEHGTLERQDWMKPGTAMVLASDYDTLKASLEAREAECRVKERGLEALKAELENAQQHIERERESSAHREAILADERRKAAAELEKAREEKEIALSLLNEQRERDPIFQLHFTMRQKAEAERDELVQDITAAHKLLGGLCGNDIHNATARDAVGAAFVHLGAALAKVRP